MLYYLSELFKSTNFTGSNLMSYVTFRAGAALVLSILISIMFGGSIIRWLQKKGMGDNPRALGNIGENEKAGTPTMGGIIIILSILIPCLLVSNLSNIYMLLLLFCTLWLGTLGAIDDYLKKKKSKDGMEWYWKIIGQTILGLVVAGTVYYATCSAQPLVGANADAGYSAPVAIVPFFKNVYFDYSSMFQWLGDGANIAGWILFFAVTLFIVVLTSNSVNLTDGLDGLATGCSAISSVVLVIFAYLGANTVYASYLSIIYVPNGEEIVVYMCAFLGSLIGFLWYNAHKADVFMGDTGSLMIGGILAIVAILLHQELVLPILCLVFYAEGFSSLMQTGYYKLSKNKETGKGTRIFRMAPLHHHFQPKKKANPQPAENTGGQDKPAADKPKVLINWPKNPVIEQKLVVRFWIISIFMAMLSLATLKIR